MPGLPIHVMPGLPIHVMPFQLKSKHRRDYF